MFSDISDATNIYIIIGYTDIKKSLVDYAIVMEHLKEEPNERLTCPKKLFGFHLRYFLRLLAFTSKLEINKCRCIIFRPIDSKNYNNQNCTVIYNPPKNYILFEQGCAEINFIFIKIHNQ